MWTDLLQELDKSGSCQEMIKVDGVPPAVILDWPRMLFMAWDTYMQSSVNFWKTALLIVILHSLHFQLKIRYIGLCVMLTQFYCGH